MKSKFKRRRMLEELDQDIRDHMEAETQDNIARGMPPDEARYAALRKFGNVTRIKEDTRNVWTLVWLEQFLQDLRYGARTLVKKPVFTAVAILTLALGVGANTAIFSIVNAVLLRPLPFPSPGQLVRIYFNNPGIGMRDVRSSVPETEDLKTRSGVFEYVTPLLTGSVNLTGAGQPERLELLVAASDYFPMLGVTPQLGRLLGPQDFALGFAPSIVISDALWHRAYGADPSVIGRAVRLDNDLYAIVGVAQPGFRHPGQTTARDVEIFTAAGFAADPAPPPARATRILPSVIGRLKPGLTLADAQARLTAMAAEIRRDYASDYPPEAKWTIEVQPLQETLVGNVRPMLLVLLGGVVLIVFIVALNIGSLLLARASGRQQEMAVRSALGASRSRLIRQMLTESLLLAFVGGLIGIVVAFGTLRSILRYIPADIPRLGEVNIDWRVLVFALLIALLTGLLFGLAPALHSTKSSLSSTIREGARGSGYSARTSGLRDVLIVSELALAVVLMIAAGLLLRTLRGLLQENPGFNPTQVVSARLWMTEPNDPKQDPYLTTLQQTAFLRELLRRMNSIPGVELAATTSNLPTTSAEVVSSLVIEDRPLDSSANPQADIIGVSPEYFKVMQAPIARGRAFSEADEDGKQPVAILDESTVRRFWMGSDALGRRIRFAGFPVQPWMTVVGIIKDIKQDGLDTSGNAHIYVPSYQHRDRSVSVVLRTSLPASMLEPQIRDRIHNIDPGLPVYEISSMDQVLDASLASHRFSADLVSGFAALALLLASVGIYGLLAYMVGTRSCEFGVRMALGASPLDILKLVLQRGVVLAAFGVATGVAIAAFTASLMASLLYGVRPHDPVVFLVVPLLLFVVALVASYIPAWRATKVDPVTSLREA